jgi:hypothetical protein
MSSAHLIVYGTIEHVCLHEAGHFLAATMVGAKNLEVEIIDGPPPRGRARAERSHDQAPALAVGGYATEFLLHKQKRLLDETGNAMTDKEFIDLVSGSLHADKIAFFGSDRRDAQGGWSYDDDRVFMEFGAAVATKLPLAELERIAAIFLAERTLDEARCALI